MNQMENWCEMNATFFFCLQHMNGVFRLEWLFIFFAFFAQVLTIQFDLNQFQTIEFQSYEMKAMIEMNLFFFQVLISLTESQFELDWN